MKKRIAIIGAGWFGCHIALEILKLKKYDIKIFDKNNKIFDGASSNNQNRLHLGFHYPRSKITRDQSKIGYKKFLKVYPFLCKKIKNNIYSIADSKHTKIDFETFLQIMKAENLSFKIINEKKFDLKNISGSITTDEMLIDVEKSRKFFYKKLKSHLSINKEIKKIKKLENKFVIDDNAYDYVINCTYYQKFVKDTVGVFYEVTASLIYKCFKNFPALTLMDGPFFTIYPFKKNYYNIYSVVHSRFGESEKISKCEKNLLKIRKNKKFLNKKRILIEKQISKFYPNFKKNFKFFKYLTCIRTIKDTENAERSFKIFKNGNFIDVYSGKIDHIMTAGEEIIGFLNKKN